MLLALILLTSSNTDKMFKSLFSNLLLEAKNHSIANLQMAQILFYFLI
jgi:hypothetical protein